MKYNLQHPVGAVSRLAVQPLVHYSGNSFVSLIRHSMCAAPTTLKACTRYYGLYCSLIGFVQLCPLVTRVYWPIWDGHHSQVPQHCRVLTKHCHWDIPNPSVLFAKRTVRFRPFLYRPLRTHFPNTFLCAVSLSPPAFHFKWPGPRLAHYSGVV